MKIEVSNGELVDKAAILKVKLERLTDPRKLGHVRAEYSYLLRSLAALGIDESSAVFRRLCQLHDENWDLIEIWNRKDSEGVYDAEYIEVTRRSNACNRERFHLKCHLNSESAIVEEKSDIYGDYRGSSGES